MSVSEVNAGIKRLVLSSLLSPGWTRKPILLPIKVWLWNLSTAASQSQLQNNQSVKLANIRMLEFVATKLQEICDDIILDVMLTE